MTFAPFLVKNNFWILFTYFNVQFMVLVITQIQLTSYLCFISFDEQLKITDVGLWKEMDKIDQSMFIRLRGEFEIMSYLFTYLNLFSILFFAAEAAC